MALSTWEDQVVSSNGGKERETLRDSHPHLGVKTVNEHITRRSFLTRCTNWHRCTLAQVSLSLIFAANF